MLLNKFLNESSLIGNEYDVEMTNEGFRFEDGGISRIISLSEAAMSEINMKCQLAEVEAGKKVISGASLSEAYILQENVITSAINGIKKIILKIWARMKEICSSVKMEFNRLFNSSAFIKDAKKILEKINDFKDLEFEGYNFTIDKLKPMDIFKDGRDKVNELFGKAESAIKSVKEGADTAETKKNIEAHKDAFDVLKSEELKKAITQKAFNCKPDEVNKTIFKTMRSGKDTVEKLTWNKSACITAVEELSKLTNEVNSVQDAVNTAHREAIKGLDESISAADKVANDSTSTTKEINNIKLNILKDKSSGLKTALDYANTATNAKLAALKAEAAQSKKFISAAIRQGRKNVRANKVSESVDLFNLDNIADQY